MIILDAIYFRVCFNPYNWQMLPKHEYDNGAEAVEGSGVQFKSRGIARTDNAPEWLEPVMSTSTLRMLLDVQTDKRKQYGPASVRDAVVENDLSHPSESEAQANIQLQCLWWP